MILYLSYQETNQIQKKKGNNTRNNIYRQVNKEDVESLIKDKNYIFCEVSAKTSQNINNLFYKDIHDTIMYKYKIGSIDNKNEQENVETPKVIESKQLIILN